MPSFQPLSLSIFHFLGCSSDLFDVVLRQTVAAGTTEDPMKIVLCWGKRGPNVPLACDIGNGCEKLARIALNLNIFAEIVYARDPLVVVHLPERFRAASVSYAPDYQTIRVPSGQMFAFPVPSLPSLLKTIRYPARQARRASLIFPARRSF